MQENYIKPEEVKVGDKILIKLKPGVDGFDESCYGGKVTRNNEILKEIKVGNGEDITISYFQIESIEKLDNKIINKLK